MSDIIVNYIPLFLYQLVTSFFGTLFFAIIFNAPRALLIPCGIVGCFGWVVYYFSSLMDASNVFASFLGALSLGIIAHIMARYFKRPVIIFYVSGIIPLVPGGTAYDATRNLITNELTKAMEKSVQAMLISGSIAFGLLFAEIIFQTVIKTKKYVQKSTPNQS